MLRDITIGQYYPSESLIHKLDPRTKIIFVFVYIISLFIVKTYIGFIPACLFLITIILISKIPFRYILKGLKPIIFLLVLTVVFNMFLGSGRVLVRIWKLSITTGGLKRGIFFAVRLILLMLGSSLLTFTTTPNKLTDGLEQLMKPLKVIKVPVHEIAMMMSIALRFIPILLEETDKIMKAQQSRGADFETGNVFKRAKSMIPIFIPLIISAFRRAFDLAMAMEARCYHGGNGRTKMRPNRYGKKDAVAFFAMLLFVAVTIAVRIIGW